MSKCPKCKANLQDIEVEEFEYGFDGYEVINESSICMCPKCETEYKVNRVYKLIREEILEA